MLANRIIHCSDWDEKISAGFWSFWTDPYQISPCNKYVNKYLVDYVREMLTSTFAALVKTHHLYLPTPIYPSNSWAPISHPLQNPPNSLFLTAATLEHQSSLSTTPMSPRSERPYSNWVYKDSANQRQCHSSKTHHGCHSSDPLVANPTTIVPNTLEKHLHHPCKTLPKVAPTTCACTWTILLFDSVLMIMMVGACYRDQTPHFSQT